MDKHGHLRLRSLLPISVTVLLGAAAPAAAEDYFKSYPVSGRADVRVEANDGAVRVVGGDLKQVEFRVEYEGYRLDRDLTIESHQSGDQVELTVRVRERFGFGGLFQFRNLRIEVRVPRQADLQVETGDGSIQSGPLEGRIDLHTGDGSITVDGLKGDVRLRTGDGSIEASGLDGKADVQTGDGRVQVDGRFDSLRVETDDGSVDVRLLPGSKMASSWTIKTGDGSMQIRLPDGFQADIDASSGDGRVEFDVPLTAEGNLSRSKARGRLNGGGPTLVLHSGDGSIRIGRT